MAYQSPQYEQILANNAVFLCEGPEGIMDEDTLMCTSLKHADPSVPATSPFHDNYFENTIKKMGLINRDVVVRQITKFIVPPVEFLIEHGAAHFSYLTGNIDQLWTHCVPWRWTTHRPQPDYTAGFNETAFPDLSRERLVAFKLPRAAGASYVLATRDVYFPFLTCEFMPPMQSLDIADLQNAHSMSIAVYGVVSLLGRSGREQTVNRQILGFSVSHNDKYVRIYGHYPVFSETSPKRMKVYRHRILDIDLMADGGLQRWAAFKFIANVYEYFAPMHLKRIRGAIDSPWTMGNGQ